LIAEKDDVPVRDGTAIVKASVHEPRPWAPAHPALYTAEIRLFNELGSEVDRYEESFGFREIRVDKGTILFNNEPLFLVGFGKHEDYPLVGRGQFRAAYIRDFELMRWIGANSFRTSHYPYDEELMRLSDRMGFLVIDEVPAVSLGFLSENSEDLAPLLHTHRQALTDLIDRDRNHPSVIAWSITNEPSLWSEPFHQSTASRRYFRTLYEHVVSQDKTRPVMAITIPVHSENDVALESCDVIGINRYYGWYTQPADLAHAQATLDEEMERIFARHGKPIVITECGADTIEGLHATTAQLFTEEFQTEFLRIYSAVAEAKPFCAGLHVWNFADFLTPQHHRRVVLNRKGVFTRNREPKSAAFFLRAHWIALKRVADAHRPPRPCDAFLIPDAKAPRP
jgi:beta-glucuronidase